MSGPGIPKPRSPIPDGWTRTDQWFGHRFEIDFADKAHPDRVYSVGLLVYSATGELRQEGPRRHASARDAREPVPAWVYMVAHAQIGALLDAMGATAPEEAPDEPEPDSDEPEVTATPYVPSFSAEGALTGRHDVDALPKDDTSP